MLPLLLVAFGFGASTALVTMTLFDTGSGLSERLLVRGIDMLGLPARVDAVERAARGGPALRDGWAEQVARARGQSRRVDTGAGGTSSIWRESSRQEPDVVDSHRATVLQRKRRKCQIRVAPS
ncbi:hypothetical protein DAEQUDRAFT_758141 [Daedalea quercina L-15889]|uniref:CNNM transmembrane domain-containing protein n=1 Tax=Daedalea quercina L-15889 TaxID=1314783 RepID=A0A165NV86_9APHY|nr:hypothetical protein DAEQUDRAFT_758141 [Daedalea quercina L-15889]